MIDVAIYYNEFDGYGNTLLLSQDVKQYETEQEAYQYIKDKCNEVTEYGFFTFRISYNTPKWDDEEKEWCIRPEGVQVPPEYQHTNGWGNRKR